MQTEHWLLQIAVVKWLALTGAREVPRLNPCCKQLGVFHKNHYNTCTLYTALGSGYTPTLQSLGPLSPLPSNGW